MNVFLLSCLSNRHKHVILLTFDYFNTDLLTIHQTATWFCFRFLLLLFILNFLYAVFSSVSVGFSMFFQLIFSSSFFLPREYINFISFILQFYIINILLWTGDKQFHLYIYISKTNRDSNATHHKHKQKNVFLKQIWKYAIISSCTRSISRIRLNS